MLKRRLTLTEQLQALADELRTEDQHNFLVEYHRGVGWLAIPEESRHFNDGGEYLGPDYEAAERTLRMLLG